MRNGQLVFKKTQKMNKDELCNVIKYLAPCEYTKFARCCKHWNGALEQYKNGIFGPFQNVYPKRMEMYNLLGAREPDTNIQVRIGYDNMDHEIYGTFSKLIEHVTSSEHFSPALNRTVIYYHYEYCASKQEFWNMLVERFWYVPTFAEMQREKSEELKKKITLVRLRTFNFMKTWTEVLPNDWSQDGVDTRVFFAQLNSISSPFKVSRLEKAIEECKQDKSEANTDKAPEPLYPKTKTQSWISSKLFGITYSSDVFDWPVVEVARQLTLMDSEKYAAVQMQELLNGSFFKTSREKKAPNIFALVNHFNSMANAFASAVLTHAKGCKAIIEYLIQLETQLAKLNNFTGLACIVSALNMAAIFRLKSVWKSLSEEVTKEHQENASIVSATSRCKKVRLAMRSTKPPLVPYLGILLTDLTFMEEGNPSMVNNLPNWHKFKRVVEIATEHLRCVYEPYALHKIPQLQAAILNMKSLANEEEMYQTSLKLVPKTKSKTASK